jgi:hypothetical protein
MEHKPDATASEIEEVILLSVLLPPCGHSTSRINRGIPDALKALARRARKSLSTELAPITG